MTELSTLVLVVALAVAIFNLLLAPRLGRVEGPDGRPLSILIPARNEESNLARLLESIPDRPDHYEVLILDDQSTDATAEIAERFARSRSNVSVLRGRPLPAGWTGKSWACHQLAVEATHSGLLFVDADVTASSLALRNTARALGDRCDVLTALPRQHFPDAITSATVPLIVQFPILALLPLALVPTIPLAALSAGNGQWIAFTRDAYRTVGGHHAVRSAFAEDVALAYRAKKKALRLEVFLATEELWVRMYNDRGAMTEGFTRNLHALIGGLWGAAPALALFYLLTVQPFIALAAGAALPMLLLVAVRLVETCLTRNSLRSVLLHPVGAVMSLALAIRSLLARRRETLSWRGRSMQVRPNGPKSGRGLNPDAGPPVVGELLEVEMLPEIPLDAFELRGSGAATTTTATKDRLILGEADRSAAGRVHREDRCGLNGPPGSGDRCVLP